MEGKLNVLIDMPRPVEMTDRLERLDGVTLNFVEDPRETERSFPVDRIKDCDVFFGTFLPENHEVMNRLKLVQISSAGYSQLVGKHLRERNIVACNARGVFDVPIAEWNVAMMINLLRDVKGLLKNQDLRVWDRDVRFQREIRGMVVGIWGYGGIGRATARLARALGMHVHVLSRKPIGLRAGTYFVPGTGDSEGILPDRYFLMDEKEAFLKSIDFLIMAIPQTADTEGVVGVSELEMLKPGAYLLNPARGPLIEEKALIDALHNGKLGGAALDTHYEYPMPVDHPLWSIPNVIMTPHISGSSGSPRFLERVYDIFIQNLEHFIQGRPLLNRLSDAELTEHSHS